MIADMHTHSEYSHDSVCPIEDMCIAQIQKGTDVMAVTDHADIFMHSTYDIYEPIRKSFEKVKNLREKYGDKILILSGVEISEGFWAPEQSKRMKELCDYDVIIGSVRYEGLTIAYSKIDFSKLTKEQVYSYLDTYFDDVLKLIEAEDFDILAHLTCPLRYITGKYKIEINLDLYNEKIEKILSRIISRKIALEINTSSFDALNDFMPPGHIIKKYFNMGGRLLTLGSDAHVAENASLNFHRAVEFIKEIGFDKLCYFQNRKLQTYDALV